MFFAILEHDEQTHLFGDKYMKVQPHTKHPSFEFRRPVRIFVDLWLKADSLDSFIGEGGRMFFKLLIGIY